jgi:hypothetical protein
MTGEPRNIKRIRQQTAVLLTAIAAQVKEDEKRLAVVPFEIISIDPTWNRLFKTLQYNRSLLMHSVDHMGTAKIKKVKPQGSRMIRAGCSCCGYTIRLSALWIAIGLPTCPNPDCDKHGKEFDVDEKSVNQDYQEFAPDQKQIKEIVDDLNTDPFADLPGAGDLPDKILP